MKTKTKLYDQAESFSRIYLYFGRPGGLKNVTFLKFFKTSEVRICYLMNDYLQAR